jgi:hypothetical protein
MSDAFARLKFALAGSVRGNVCRFAGLLGVLVLHGPKVAAQGVQPSPCDASLSQSIADRNGYRQRGDRCEGVYIQGVTSQALRLISFTGSFENFDPASGTDLRLEWNPPAGGSAVHLRANSLRPRLYYRFDAIRPAGGTSYSWPPAVLRELQLRKPELGVVAWVTQQVGSATRDVYLPVRVGQRAAPAAANGYLLVLVPGVELVEVYVTLVAVKADGQPGKPIQESRPLGRVYYPAERDIPILIAPPTTPGVYYLHIGAPLREGGSADLRLWFYHSGE